MSLLSNAPYYDRYDSSKQYSQLLAVPGRVAQARELTEIQSTMKDIIKSIGDSILNDGNVIEGCQVIADKVNKKVTVTSGKIYMRGMVMSFSESSIDISAIGTEMIGVQLKETIIYATDDPDLKDPALGFENYNQPGCDRLKSSLVLVNLSSTANDSSTAVLATIIDGEVSVEQQAPNYSALNETLARRTYDESGSYIVEGMNVRVESSTDPEKFNVVVETGKAYVHGYEIKLSAARRIELPRSTTSTTVTARYNYADGATYLLSTGPYVKSINSVTGAVKVTDNVTINNAQGAVLLHNTAYNIVEVKTKTGDTVDPSSYRLEQGPTSYIRWNDSTYPGDGTLVSYYYTYEFTPNTDYELLLQDNNHYLKWLNSSRTPVVGEPMNINLDKYFARKDTVYIDQNGEISVVQGNPADYGFETAEEAPAYTLALATIMSPPGGKIELGSVQNINVSNVGLTRFTMNDIHKMLRRIRTIEYDQTVLSLNTEAKEYATVDKRGIFTDPFIDYSKIDFYFNLANGVKLLSDRPIFDVAIDTDSNMVYLPLVNKIIDAEFDDTKADSLYRNNRTVSLGKISENVVLSQMQATKSYQVSPYLVYNQSPEIFITPSVDTWFDDTIVEVAKSINTTEVITQSTRYLPSTTRVMGGSFSAYDTTSSSSSTSNIGVRVDTLMDEDVISEEAVTYIRPRQVEVAGSHYPANLDNIKCYFDGVESALTPTGTSVSGSATGSIKADANGSFTAKFTIPSHILAGTRIVTLKSDNVVAGYSNEAFTYYTASGTKRTIQRTVTTVNTVLQERVTSVQTVRIVDPLAQTFILEDMTLLSGIDVYFESVPTKNTPVSCELREVVNGNITSTIYGFKTLSPTDINVSANGTVATRFRFNDPVLIEANKEYAFVLKSASQDYRVYVAEIGETDIRTGEIVSANPYLLGVMMSSSNNMSWTTHQKTDMKFRLISDNYTTSADVYFKDITLASGFCQFFVTADTLILDGTRINWSYSLDEGATYTTFSPYNNIVIDQLATKLRLKASMSRSANAAISPILALDTVTVSMSKYDNAAPRYYVSNLISGLDEYDTIELIVDTYETSGTSLKVFASPSANNASPYIMKEGVLTDSVEKSYGWFEKTYTISLDSVATQCRLFIELRSNTSFHTPAFRRLRAIMS